MLYFYRIDAFEEIDVNKASASKEWDVSYYWWFLKHIFKFQPNVCNKYHDLLMMPMNLSNIDILSIEDSRYCCIISLISKNEAKNLI